MDKEPLIILSSLRKMGFNFSESALQEVYFSTLGVNGLERFKKMFSHLGLNPIFCRLDDISDLEGSFFIFGLDTPIDLLTFVEVRGDRFHLRNEYDEEVIDKADFEKRWNNSRSVFVFLDDSKIVKLSIFQKIRNVSFEIKQVVFLSILGFLMLALSIPGFSYLFLPTFLSIIFSAQLLIDSEKNKIESSLRFCKTNESFDCARVLSSKFSKFFGFELAYLALSYFFTIIFLSLFKYDVEQLLLISVLSVFMIAYSLVIQTLVLKNYCKFCLIIDALLVVQVFLFYRISDFRDFTFDYLFVAFFFIVFSVFYLFVYLYAKFVAFSLSANKKMLEGFSYKRDYLVFESRFLATSELSSFDFSDRVFINRVDSNNSIDLVLLSNPFCKSCSSNFKSMLSNLDKFKDHVNIEIRFLVDPSSSPDKINLASDLIFIYHNFGVEEFVKAYLDWIKIGDFLKWRLHWGRDTVSEYNVLLSNITAWSDVNRVYFTPLMILDGRPLSSFLDIVDLTYLIPRYCEYYATQTNRELTGNY